ncbi:MAG: ptlH [Streptosporangiaceae bacterium]|nr:ptlH [Streptosporangiaceae bacterium]
MARGEYVGESIADRAVGVLRSLGVSGTIPWATPDAAGSLAAELAARHGHHREIVRNPHRSVEWARAGVRSPTLLSAVQAAIGPDVAVENTFLIMKWPGRDFEVPWHQDGIDHRIHLDPDRSVSAWLALTDATLANGCLHVAPGSQRLGYLPYELEEAHGQARGRAGRVAGFSGEYSVPVTVSAGHAVLMDVRLLHRSGPNSTQAPRIGLNVRYVAPGAVQMRDHTPPDLDPISGPSW